MSSTLASSNPQPVSIRLEPAGESFRILIDVADQNLYGHDATLTIERTVRVHDSRGIHSTETLSTKSLSSLGPQQEVMIPRILNAYSYHGSQIDIVISTKLKIDDGLVFDTAVSDEQELSAGMKPAVSGNAKEMIEPADAFNFVANFNAIPARNKMITLVLMLVAGIVIGINTLVGIRDELTPDGRTWFYDHRGSKGSESPLMKSLVGSGALGAAIWFAIRRQLRQYMTFELGNVPTNITRTDEIAASSLVRGVSRVQLDDVVVRVIACNMEKGQYSRGSGTKRRTVSFTEPVRAVKLYERQLRTVPAGVPIESFLDGKIAFEPMFKTLYPPQQVGASHGIAIRWEVQLLHQQFVDQELVGPDGCFSCGDFMEA